MKGTPETDTTRSITGHAFIFEPDRCVAIYERNGESWVAEFHQGRGELSHASVWFRSDVGGHRCRRAAYRSAVALTPKLGATVRRCWTRVTTTLRPSVSPDGAGRSIE